MSTSACWEITCNGLDSHPFKGFSFKELLDKGKVDQFRYILKLSFGPRLRGTKQKKSQQALVKELIIYFFCFSPLKLGPKLNFNINNYNQNWSLRFTIISFCSDQNNCQKLLIINGEAVS